MHQSRILEISYDTHNVIKIKTEKFESYNFRPGEATEVAIDKTGWQDKKRPFTFTSLNENDYLEFIVKIYNDHEGVTNEMKSLIPGDILLIDEPWGAIQYKGPGYFVAGGSGITPFIAILRDLKSKNQINGNILFFANKSSDDIICENELYKLLGKENTVFTTDFKHKDYDNRFIDKFFLEKEVKDINKPFYVCGPMKMVADVNKILRDMGASVESIVFEK